MPDVQFVLLLLVLICGFYMAWNIGANDVANAIGTSVGSRALTLKQAVILAAIFEFLGAFLVGSKVSDTMRKRIFDTELLAQIYTPSQFGEQYAPILLGCGMIAALLAAGSWLMFASYFGFPVSTTHSIVGAVVGFGCVAVGVSEIEWRQVGAITGGWILSPLMSGTVSYLAFRIVLHLVFYKRRPVDAAKVVIPYLVLVALVVLIGVVAIKGLSSMWENYGIDDESPQFFIVVSIVSLLIGMTGMFFARTLVQRVELPALEGPADAASPGSGMTVVTPDISRALTKAAVYLRRVRDRADGQMADDARRLLADIDTLHEKVREETSFGTDSRELQAVERMFTYLQMISACFLAFSHGANDVANAIGPLAGAYQSISESKVVLRATTPTWALALGGAGIVVGLATWGWRVVRTVGERITELTPSRGFCAEFGASLVILVASVTGLPVSTTHILVGSVLGVGLARGLGALNLSMMRDIVASWIITVPAGAILSILFFYILKLIFLDTGLAL